MRGSKVDPPAEEDATADQEQEQEVAEEVIEAVVNSVIDAIVDDAPLVVLEDPNLFPAVDAEIDNLTEAVAEAAQQAAQQGGEPAGASPSDPEIGAVIDFLEAYAQGIPSIEVAEAGEPGDEEQGVD